MTPQQQRFVDYATVEAAAQGFAFELSAPRDDREGASLKIKGRSGYDTLGISPDGWVGLVGMSQSYDRDLSKFTKKLLAAGKKMRAKEKPARAVTSAKKPPATQAKRCTSGNFKNHPIIRQIVDRVHVGTPDAEVLDYARSRLAPGAWDKMSAKERKAFECEVLKAHERNRASYRRVSGSHATKKSPKKARVVHVETRTPAGYRWLRTNARGATETPEGFAVTDEHEWARSLAAAGAIEIK